MKFWFLALTIILTITPPLSAQTPSTSNTTKSEDPPSFFLAYVISVTDGNWIETEREGKHVSIRLYGTYCPSRTTVIGLAASEELGKLVFGQTVQVKRVGFFPGGGILAQVTVDKTNVNEELLSRGLAAVQASLDLPDVNKRYRELETQAKVKGLGMWSPAPSSTPSSPSSGTTK